MKGAATFVLSTRKPHSMRPGVEFYGAGHPTILLSDRNQAPEEQPGIAVDSEKVPLCLLSFDVAPDEPRSAVDGEKFRHWEGASEIPVRSDLPP